MGIEWHEWIGVSLSGERYYVLSLLGEGGMGFVYKARDKNLNNEVVIKVPRRALLEEAQTVERFQREIRSLVQLSHPHIAKILDVGDREGVPFAVMSCLAGGDLETRRLRNDTGVVQPMNPASLRIWLPAVAKALDFVHCQGYVHRDIKPSNILFDNDNNPYISDFGIAKVLAESGEGIRKGITGTGMVLGTPEYMAPELIMGHAFDGRADQYSLAMTIYDILAGGLPFSGATPAAILVKQATEAVPTLQSIAKVAPQLSEILTRALSKDPDNRFLNCREMARAILSATSGMARKSTKRAATVSGATEPTGSDLACPLCQHVISVKAGNAGRVIDCPGCGVLLSVANDVQLLQPFTPDSDTVRHDGTVRETAKVVSVPTEKPRRHNWNDFLQRLRGVPIYAWIALSIIALTFVFYIWHSLTSGQSVITNSIGMRLVLIPPGEFLMGSPPTELGRGMAEVQHTVRISRSFYMGECEITQEQYQQVMGTNPSYFSLSGGGKDQVAQIDTYRLPVECVTWYQAVEFCHRLSNLPEEKAAGLVYRLPTEAEWEFACRADSTTAYSFDDSSSEVGDYAWFGDNSGDVPLDSEKILAKEKNVNSHFRRLLSSGCRPRRAGRKRPNAWGLYDIHGNVWEWCSDWYGDYSPGEVTDALGPSAGLKRVIRGGCFGDVPKSLRSAYRNAVDPGKCAFGWGFRVVAVSAENIRERADIVLPSRSLPPPASSEDRLLSAPIHETARSQVTNSVGMQFILINPGTFTMGSPPNESQRSGIESQHAVKITRPFYLGRCEVTQEQYQRVIGDNPSKFPRSDRPVERVSWDEAKRFCQQLSRLPEESLAGRSYRLPTEAEWEYACRAGTTAGYCFGSRVSELGDFCWFGNNSGDKAILSRDLWASVVPSKKAETFHEYFKQIHSNGNSTHPVGKKLPNEWGMYDMHGNVWEWCSDWVGPYPKGLVVNPTGPAQGQRKVIRGGSYFYHEGFARCAARSSQPVGFRAGDTGFRVVMELQSLNVSADATAKKHP